MTVGKPGLTLRDALSLVTLVFVALGLGAFAAVMEAFFGGPSGKRYPLFGVAVLLVFFGIGRAGYCSLGWLGVPIFYIAAIALAMTLGLCWVCAYMFVFGKRFKRARVRMSELSTDRLMSITANPSDPAFGLAYWELDDRGVDGRPSKERLFAMLTSGDSVQCGKAMVFLAMYPEVQLPLGSLSADPPEVWRSRIETMESGS